MQIAGMPLSGEHGAAFAKVKCSALGHKGPGTEAAGQAVGRGSYSEGRARRWRKPPCLRACEV